MDAKAAQAFIKAVRKNIGIAIMGAFALVIALVWNETIKEGVNKLMDSLGIQPETYLFKIVAAIIVTVICVIGILLFSRWAEKK
jgi:uncharacterized membrane protein